MCSFMLSAWEPRLPPLPAWGQLVKTPLEAFEQMHKCMRNLQHILWCGLSNTKYLFHSTSPQTEAHNYIVLSRVKSQDRLWVGILSLSPVSCFPAQPKGPLARHWDFKENHEISAERCGPGTGWVLNRDARAAGLVLSRVVSVLRAGGCK